MKSYYFLLLCICLSSCQFLSPHPKSISSFEIEPLVIDLELSSNKIPSDSLLFLGHNLLELAKKLNDKSSEARISLLLAKVLTENEAFDEAIVHLSSAIDQFTIDNNFRFLSKAYKVMSFVFLETDNYDKAFYSIHKAMEYSQSEPHRKDLASLYGHLGHIYEKTQVYDSALLCQKKALEYFESQPDSVELAVIYDNIGSIYEDLELYDEAKFYFEKAYEYNLGIKSMLALVSNLNNIGDVYRKTGNYNMAMQYTKESYTLATKIKNLDQIQSAARDISKTFADINEYDSAYYYLSISYEYKNEWFGERMAKELAKEQIKFDLEKKKQTIVAMKKDRQNTLTLIRLGGLSLILITGLISYGSFLKSSKNKKEKQLLKIENELNKSELLNAQLNEEKLKAEIENKRLFEKQLQDDLEMKNGEISRSALHMIRKNEFLKSLRDNLKKIKKSEPEDVKKKVNKLTKAIDLSFTMDEDWQEFESVFKKVHVGFYEKLKEKHPNLSAAEVRLCTMIHSNLQSHEISSILNISSDSLRIARYRLRKKIQLEKGSNLYTYLSTIS
ncbi:tetratricopeptide repeat protein [Reichenbachiella versicolor]|uniref:tetratricopeptide repeat protein n=1 Tax=Reichenbachiella versicolor TaxID=1821036 RepID=UPI000D6E1B6C|nr:tetratricopeptide repeat protein [Reichenbachiella versicolor]